MSDILYTDHARVLDVDVQVDSPRYGHTVSGYGGKIPTRYRLKYATPTGKRWLRVYVMQYGNAGSPYVIVGGKIRHLDVDTEHLFYA